MIEAVLIGAGWLLLTLPTSVLIGKCIAVGQAGETARHAAAAAAPTTEEQESSGAALPGVPAQRQPVASRHLVG